jgi:hypothetical protein
MTVSTPSVARVTTSELVMSPQTTSTPYRFAASRFAVVSRDRHRTS